jgi:molecular chaperone DnaK
MSELGDKVSGEERAAIEAAVQDLKAVLKNDDKAVIEAKAKALSDASGKMAERLYAAKNEAGATQGQQGSGAGQSGGDAKKDDVVDAEFEEVKKDKS